VASKNGFKQEAIQAQLKNKTVWAAGTQTWEALAAADIWVDGCADGLGLEQLERTWQMPLLSIGKEQVTILTHEGAADYWKRLNWHTAISYRTKPNCIQHLSDKIKVANFFFWTNAAQYLQCQPFIPSTDAIHACPSGATLAQLKHLGVEPIVFPTIQSFKAWSRTHGL
jgi:uroporphyrinogen-III synthase